MIQAVEKLCECGCGKAVSQPNHRFVHGHNGVASRRTAQQCLDVMLNKIAIDTESGCWNWQGERNRRGNYGLWHGRQSYQSRLWLAHRLMWTLVNGEIPQGMCVCHKCDNPACVYPLHLFIGTQADNSHDRDRKGRQRSATGESHGSKTHPERVAKGESHPMAVLNWDSVREIRRRLELGHTGVSLAKEFGVSTTNISDIRKRRIWIEQPVGDVVPDDEAEDLSTWMVREGHAYKSKPKGAE